jgi:iron complex transport system ATP-binding protein
LPPPVLELTDATVIRDGFRVLDGLTLRIAEGEHTAIVGPNGAGKSFFVRLFTLEERAVASEDGTPVVRVFGRDVWDVFQLRARLGIVSADLHQRFVAGNNEGRITGEAAVLSGFLATHGILRHGAVTDDMRERAAAALARMGVAHLAARRLDEMSNGQARRVVLARALVSEPRALLLDEPTTGLDIAARFDFMERVRGIARGGTTIILVTHHIEEIIPEIGRVLLMRDGRIAADGPKSAILTAKHLSRLFDTPITLTETNGYFQPSLGGARVP